MGQILDLLSEYDVTTIFAIQEDHLASYQVRIYICYRAIIHIMCTYSNCPIVSQLHRAISHILLGLTEPAGDHRSRDICVGSRRLLVGPCHCMLQWGGE